MGRKMPPPPWPRKPIDVGSSFKSLGVSVKELERAFGRSSRESLDREKIYVNGEWLTKKEYELLLERTREEEKEKLEEEKQQKEKRKAELYMAIIKVVIWVSVIIFIYLTLLR